MKHEGTIISPFTALHESGLGPSGPVVAMQTEAD